MPVNTPVQRRHKNFEATHQQMIETAARLLSEKGPDALSLSELSRVMGINRTTVYYHFQSREDLLAAVKAWSSEQLAKALEPFATPADRIDYITRFVLENPELIRLWIDDFVCGGDIRSSYPRWDDLVDGIGASLADKGVDPEVYCVMLLASAYIAPHVFKTAVHPDIDKDEIIGRFRAETLRALKRDGMIEE
jgi:AcrR family transcriptional regulator